MSKPFRKLNKIEKIQLKFSDRQRYKEYKAWLTQIRFNDTLAENPHPNLIHPFKDLTGFSHAGNSGDIIYSLPAMYALCGEGKANLFLEEGKPGLYAHYHPLGNVMLNDKMIQMLVPLLTYQQKIALCKKHEGEPVDYELDIFRKFNFSLGMGNIARWYSHVFAIYPNLGQPWLTAPVDERYKETIVVARSHRYRNPGIDYSFLNKYDNLVFAGIQEEYEDMKKMIPKLTHEPVKDFLQLATIINSCRFFIGNQSFPFSIAEGLKINRLLEICYYSPNVIVEGNGAYDFMYQPQFERTVEILIEKTKG